MVIVSAGWANRTFKRFKIYRVAEDGGPIGDSFELLLDTLFDKIEELESEVRYLKAEVYGDDQS